MIEVILSNLQQNFPQIAGYAVLAVLIGVIVWQAAKFYFRTSMATAKLGDFEVTLHKIDRGLTTLNQILLEKSVISQSCYSNENSPRVVNAAGEKLLIESGAKDLFVKIKENLLQSLASKQFDSLLELERTALEVLLEKMNDPEFKSIQNFAFEHPTFNGQPLTYTDILFMMALYLRDEYRQRNPNANLES